MSSLRRKGQVPPRWQRIEFTWRFAETVADPAFGKDMTALKSIEGTAWDGYHHSRKSPVTRKAGREFAKLYRFDSRRPLCGLQITPRHAWS